ncbi:unnamed protein product [Symbiodinium pilosum]|uniref:Signal transduction histidine kinase dimerisation/phosphoacceptor domain-containing protein n=1 Tax=Symbiodinium pilosum TaxID=2952 RepID=A0A812KNL9_SYMPI|nr:unnamed protein product [Symbiodinium pilosum]
MKAQLSGLRKPDASTMEALYTKYHQICMSQDPPLQEVHVNEPDMNWKALILSLPSPDNEKVLGCGVRRMLLKRADCVYDGIYRFHVERRDLSQMMFDFRDAYDDPYHHYKDKSFIHDVDTALRAAILPHLVQFKELHCKDSQMELVSHISGTALPWEKAVVQHFPVTLRVLLDAFMNENQIDLENIKLEFCEDHGYKIKDPELMDKWRLFHRSYAQYRIISTDEAMEQVARVLKEVIEERKSKANLEAGRANYGQVLRILNFHLYASCLRTTPCSRPAYAAMMLGLSDLPFKGVMSVPELCDGMTKGAICIGQDITEMKELDIKKSNLAAAVTHELRSPLHGIIGLSEQLISTAGMQQQARLWQW